MEHYQNDGIQFQEVDAETTGDIYEIWSIDAWLPYHTTLTSFHHIKKL